MIGKKKRFINEASLPSLIRLQVFCKNKSPYITNCSNKNRLSEK